MSHVSKGDTVQGSGTAAQRHWDRMGGRHRSGVCVPVASLRSDRQMGVGDAADLRDVVDFCAKVGATVLQILPINDMGLDAVPYSALSAFALDPLYIAVDEVPGLGDHPDLQARVKDLGYELNQPHRVDARLVRDHKLTLLWELFQRVDSPDLEQQLEGFQRENPWLADYLEFRVQKECEEFRSWEEWGDGAVGPSLTACPSKLEERSRVDHRKRFHAWLQWVLEGQFAEARAYANAKGVFIEGDVPILVARDSADVWRNRHLFRMDTVAGAPPDMYAEDGQNWGFPTYDWAALEAQDYGWWRQRLRQASKFMDLVRIDHVVGFFRIWTIAHGQTSGKHGRFVPEDEGQWGAHGRRILQMMLDTTDMLPLAEDLGTIPHVCRDTLRDMGICGLKVQRWEKWWEGDRSFLRQEHYHPLSVATLSTHDSETFAQWWQHQQEPAERQEWWHLVGNTGEPPSTVTREVGLTALGWMSGVGSTFVIHLLQDLLHPFGLLPGDPADHRINIPGLVSPDNWSWRCPVTTENLARNEELVSSLRTVLTRE